MVIQRSEEDRKVLSKIGERIKVARLAKGYSRPLMAKMIGYKDVRSLFLLENAQVTTLDVILLMRIADIVGVKFKDLVKD